MPTRKKRRHRKRKTYKRGGRILKSVQTTADGYVDSKIMPSTNNNGLLENNKFVPSVKSPWLPRLNEAKYANNMLFGKKGKVKQKAMFIILNNEMENQQVDLYNEIDSEAEAEAEAATRKPAARKAAARKAAADYEVFGEFLLKYFPTPGTVGAVVPVVAPEVVAQEVAAPVVAAEIEKLFKKETLWPKDKDNRNFYIPGKLLNTLKNVFNIKNNNDELTEEQIKKIRQLMYEHRTSIYHLIDDKMVETFMDAVDNTNKKYSSIYKKGDTTTYDNIRYVIMWILFKIDSIFFVLN